MPCSRTNCTLLLNLPGEKPPWRPAPNGHSKHAMLQTEVWWVTRRISMHVRVFIFFSPRSYHNGKVKWNRWPCRLRRRVVAARLLGLRVLIPQGSGMSLSLVRVVCYRVEVSATRRSLVQKRSTEGGVCVLSWSARWPRPTRTVQPCKTKR
jgi:hypothetical protein